MDITAQELKEKLDNGKPVRLIDVRELHEHQDFNIGGDLIPLGSLPSRTDEIGDQDEEVVVYCRSGARSGMAQDFLKQQGYKNVRNLIGGMLHWEELYGRG